MATKLNAHPDLCIGCYACLVACQQEKGLAPGEALLRVKVSGPSFKEGGRLSYDLSIRFCQHCPDAPCQEACSSQAILRTGAGLITINQDLCTGCLVCLDACTTGYIALKQENGSVMVCDLCSHDGTDSPQCAKHCPAGALTLAGG